MLFASTSLAARIERAEARLVTDSALAAQARRPSEGAFVMELAGGVATLPEHRRRGVQGALLGARLEAAARAGCDVAVVTTQPGSKSQENVQKRGFELLYTRAILVKDS